MCVLTLSLRAFVPHSSLKLNPLKALQDIAASRSRVSRVHHDYFRRKIASAKG